MTDKQDMAKSGKIEDMRIFKLMYLEKSINETKLLAELKKRAFNDQIEQLKTERQSQTRAFELRARTLEDQVNALRSVFEGEYEIKLPEWGYDDSTGVLVVLDPETLNALHAKAAIHKEIAAKKSEEKKKRVKRKRKAKVVAAEEPQPDVLGPDVSPEPPVKLAEA